MREGKSWTKKRAEVMSTPGAGAAHEAARIRFEFGEVVRERREELGLTALMWPRYSELRQVIFISQ